MIFFVHLLNFLTKLLLQSEFLNWLPSVSCIFYVGGKDQRSKLFSQVRKLLCFHYMFLIYFFDLLIFSNLLLFSSGVS